MMAGRRIQVQQDSQQSEAVTQLGTTGFEFSQDGTRPQQADGIASTPGPRTRTGPVPEGFGFLQDGTRPQQADGIASTPGPRTRTGPVPEGFGISQDGTQVGIATATGPRTRTGPVPEDEEDQQDNLAVVTGSGLKELGVKPRF